MASLRAISLVFFGLLLVNSSPLDKRASKTSLRKDLLMQYQKRWEKIVEAKKRMIDDSMDPFPMTRQFETGLGCSCMCAQRPIVPMARVPGNGGALPRKLRDKRSVDKEWMLKLKKKLKSQFMEKKKKEEKKKEEKKKAWKIKSKKEKVALKKDKKMIAKLAKEKKFERKKLEKMALDKKKKMAMKKVQSRPPISRKSVAKSEHLTNRDKVAANTWENKHNGGSIPRHSKGRKSVTKLEHLTNQDKVAANTWENKHNGGSIPRHSKGKEAIKMAAHRLIKEAHEEAIRTLMERKELKQSASMQMDMQIGMHCNCTCSLISTGTMPPYPEDGPHSTWSPIPSCYSSEIKCNGTQICIESSYVCDGDNDCGDDEDEERCGTDNPLPQTTAHPIDCPPLGIACNGTQNCIPPGWLCDGFDDCGDNEDETGCGSTQMPEPEPEPSSEPGACPQGWTACPNGDCIRANWICDGANDCGDDYDELDCPEITCQPEEFKCKNRSRCISQGWLCDGDNDCGDFSDEQDCHIHSCSPHEFQCDNGRCVNAAYICDRDDDCHDYSDERNCTATEVPSCEPDEFQCDNGRCINPAFICDHDNDCHDYSDERNCTATEVPSCEPHKFQCNDGRCISNSWLCDGDNDCGAAEDEANCPGTSTGTCDSDQFECKNGDCINMGFKCDRDDDCHDGSDESASECPGLEPASCTRPADAATGTCGRRYFAQDMSEMPEDRIVGGVDAQRAAYPYQISLRHYDRHICGGTIVDAKTIITAAHCLGDSASAYTIMAGSHALRIRDECAEQKLDVKHVIRHPQYDGNTEKNDIAILKLENSLTFTQYVQPACLPNKDFPYTSGEPVLISGWGALNQGGGSPNILNVAAVPLVSQTECQQSYGQYNMDITADMVCAAYHSGGIDTCQGDSGGPLVSGPNNGTSGFTLVGVVSWGIGCARPGLPGVYARVTHFLDWIAEYR